MPTLSDARFTALRGQGFTGATSDMLLAWLQANGASAKAMPDAWRELLAANGFSGNRSEAWFNYLGSLGYTGNLNDREMAFWQAGGSVSPNGVRITQQPVTYSGNEGTTATFTVAATSGNASPLSYQWQEYVTSAWGNLANAGRISGVTTTVLSIAAIIPADNSRMFRCNVTNTFNTVSSQSATIVLAGAFWYITDQLGNRLIDEPMVDLITDERSL